MKTLKLFLAVLFFSGKLFSQDVNQGNIEYNKGKDLYDKKDYYGAEPYFKKAIQIYKNVGERKYQLYTMAYLSETYYYSTRYDDAINLDFECLSLATELGENSSIVTANNRLGRNYFSKGQYNQALTYFLSQYNQNKGTSDIEGRKIDLQCLIDTYKNLKNTSSANKYQAELDALTGNSSGQSYGSSGGSQESGAFSANLGATVSYQLSGDYNRGGAMSPDGQKFAIGGASGNLKIFNTSDGSLLKTLTGHSSYVNGLAFSADGQKLASVCSDKTLKIWDVNGGYVLKTMTGFTTDEIAVAFSPDGRYVAAGGFDKLVKIYDVQSGSLVRTLSNFTGDIWSLQFSPDGRSLLSGEGSGNIIVWNTSSWTESKRAFQSGWITSIRFTSDGQKVISTSEGTSVYVWSFPGMSQLHSVNHSGKAWMSAVSPDDRYVVSSGADKTVRVWDINSGSSIQLLEGHTATVGVVLFSSDGQKIVSASDDNTIRIWNVSGVGGQSAGSGGSNSYASYSGSNQGADFSADLSRTVSSELSGDWTRAGAMAPDGQKFAVGSGTGTLKIFSTYDGSVLKSLIGHTSWMNGLAFSPDGQKLASASSDKSVRVWSVSGGHALNTFTDFTDHVLVVAFSPDGRYLAASGYDKYIKIYDMNSGSVYKTIYGHNTSVWSLQFTADGSNLLSGDADGKIKLWNTSAWSEEKSAFHSGTVTSIQFTSDGQKFVTTSSGNTTKIWSFPSMAELNSMSHTDKVWMASISPDDRYVATAGSDNVIRVWDLNSGSSVKTMYGHSAPVGVILFSTDGQKLVSGSDDNTVRLWTVSGVGSKSAGGYNNNNSYSGGSKTLTVAKDGSGSYSTIASALSAATAGDIIQVKRGTYYESAISISASNIKLMGDGPEKSIIDGGGNANILDVKNASGVTISGFTFKNSTGTAGTIQFNQSNVTFTNNVVRDNSNYGIYMWGNSPIVSNNVFYNNCAGQYAEDEDPIAMNGASPVIKNNIFYANKGGSAIDNENSSFPTITYNIIYSSGQTFKRCYGGTGNLTVDPLLNTTDFSVRTGSPAIGRGESGLNIGILSKGALSVSGGSGKVDANLSKTLYGHSDKVRAIDYSSDGKFIASGDASGAVILWDAATGTKLRTLKGHTSWVNGVAFSPDGSMVASGSSDHNVIVWDVSSGRQVRVLTGHTDLIVPVRFSPNGQFVASGSFDNTVKIWDAQSGALIKTLTGHGSSLWGMAFSNDGNLLASGDTGGEIFLWNTTTWTQVRKMKSAGTSNWVDGLVFTQDNKYLYAGGYDNNIAVWEVATGSALKTLYGHTDHVWGVSISPDGKVLASASEDRTVKLWDVGTGQLIKTLSDAKEPVFSAVFNQDGSKLVASSDDKNVYMWSVSGIGGGEKQSIKQAVKLLPPYLTATASFSSQELKSGQSGKITLTVRNTGKGPALGVNGVFTITEGSLGMFIGNPSYYIGDIQPGDVKTITTNVDADQDVISQKVSVKVEATEQNGFGADPIILNFSTRAQDPPLLSVNKYVLRDDGSGQSLGNGDGIIQKKETVELTVFISNSGQGAANNVKMTLTATDPNIFISQGSADLGAINPGESKKGIFVFAVNSNYNSTNVNLPLSLDLTEKRPKFNKSENLALTLGTEYKKEVVIDAGSTGKEDTRSSLSTGNLKDRVDEAVKEMNMTINKMAGSMGDIELPARENVYAVVIGISDYKNKDVPALSFAVNDASSMFALLTNPVIGGIPKSNVKFLVGNDASLTEIKVALGWLVNQGIDDEEATLIFYYSGHGAPEQDAQGNVKTAYLIPYDGQPKFLAETGIGIDYIQQELGKVKSKNVFVAMDACFTGSGRSFVKQGARGINLVPKDIIKDVAQGRAFLTAAANDQSAFDYPDYKHGLFTQFVLEALSGKGDSDPQTGNNDGWVTTGEIFSYAKDRVSKTARKLENVKQEPQMIGTGEIKVTRTFQKQGGALSLEDKTLKIKKAFNNGEINMNQYVKAVGEIKSGKESQTLKDFISGKIDSKKFKERY